MAAPMVRKFFEGIKDDIKETIAPPKKALIVVSETQEGAKPAGEGVNPNPGDTTTLPTSDGPLKAIPVEPLDLDRDLESNGKLEPAPAKARPVRERDVIEDNIEEP